MEEFESWRLLYEDFSERIEVFSKKE